MNRRKLREHIFYAIFLVEFCGREEVKEQIQLYLENLEYLEVADAVQIQEKAAKIIEAIPDLDDKINESANGWKTKRMNKVDLAILRLALFEILLDEEVPEKVAFDEGIELAKKYSSDEAPSFINGVLAGIVKRDK